MNNKKICRLLCAGWVISWSLASVALAADIPSHSPEPPKRTYQQNFKDMMLALCIATAYETNREAALDAGSSFSALVEWTYYDLEHSPDAMRQLVKEYLSRDYRNPIAETEIKGLQFSFLKCLDMYHSKTLAELTKRFVPHPKQTYRTDHPAASQ